MAELPPFLTQTPTGIEPGLPQVTTSEAPRSNVSPGEIASPYQQLGSALDKAGHGLEKVAEPLAERAGLQAVTTDANGNVKVDHWPIVGQAGVEYARAMKFAAVSEGEGAAKRADLALRQQHRDDPEGYTAAATAFRDTTVKKYTDAAGPEVGLTIGKLIDAQTTTTYRGLLNEKERLDLSRAESSMRAGIARAQDTLVALANGGVTSGKEWDAANGQMRALYGEMTANPRLGVSKDMTNYELDKFNGELKVAGIRYHANEIYQKDGPNAAVEFGKSIMTDTSLPLNEVQRRAAFETVRGEIRMNEAERREDVRQISLDFQAYKDSGGGDAAAIGEFHKRFMDAKAPTQADAVAKYGTLRQAIGPFNKMPIPEAQGQIDTLGSRIAAGTATPLEVSLHKELSENLAQTRKGLAEGGASFVAGRFPDHIEQPPAIDPGKPEGLGPAIAARANIAKIGESVYQNGAVPVLGKDEGEQVRSILQGAGGPKALASVAQSLDAGSMQALLQEKPVRDGIEGMTRSGDPAKMNTAFSFMDAQQKANPLLFDQQFKDGLKNLRAWQSNLSFYPPDEAAKRMMRAYDPDQSAAHQVAIKAADEQLKAVSPDKVVAKFSTGFGPVGTTARAPVSDQVALASGALKADYDQNYRDGFAATGDPTAADNFAMEKLHLKYAVSPVNGNRVMPYAPERYYPAVGGSQDWMGKQLDEAVKEATGATAAPAADVPARQSPAQAVARARRANLETPGNREYQAPRALVADDMTERDIANGRPPSYQVMVQDGKGRWGAITAADGSTAGRFRFDQTAPTVERANQMQERRDSEGGFLDDLKKAGSGILGSLNPIGSAQAGEIPNQMGRRPQTDDDPTREEVNDFVYADKPEDRNGFVKKYGRDRAFSILKDRIFELKDAKGTGGALFRQELEDYRDWLKGKAGS